MNGIGKRARGTPVGEGDVTATQRVKVDPLDLVTDKILQLTKQFEQFALHTERRFGKLDRKMNQMYDWFREQNPDATPILEDEIEEPPPEVKRKPLRQVDPRVVKLFGDELLLLRDCTLLKEEDGVFKQRLEKEFERISKQQEIDDQKEYPFDPKHAEVLSFPFISELEGCMAIQTTHPLKKEREDRECKFTLSIMTPSGMSEAECHCVLDGHGGPEVAQFCKENIQATLQASMDELNMRGTQEEISNALKMGFVLLDSKSRVFPKKPSTGFSPGTTICLAMIVNRSLYVANAGDSRAILITNKETRQLSYDFNARDVYSQKATRSRKGNIVCRLEKDRLVWRVEGSLAVTRVAGDWYLWNPSTGNKATTSRPKVTFVPLDGSPAVLMLTTDGFTGVASCKQAASAVRELNAQGKSLTEIAQVLAGAAKATGMRDDITVYLIDLTHKA